MSSLLQFNGRISKRGVHLQFTHSPKVKRQWGPADYQFSESPEDTDCIFLPGGKRLARIWTAPRVPCGMLGPWVVFRYNGKEHVPDLSIPIAVDKLPRDARPMPIAECIKTWFS